jgi:hypothetical protein
LNESQNRWHILGGRGAQDETRDTGNRHRATSCEEEEDDDDDDDDDDERASIISLPAANTAATTRRRRPLPTKADTSFDFRYFTHVAMF